ncbi:MAG: glycosyltransferase family 39 protein, partial [Actinobacteria bacterium]|nr:glycosyltransferase family 39 protein [Actinomycetota bacterium]
TFWVSLIRPSAGLAAGLAIIAASPFVALGLLGVQAARARWRRPAMGRVSAVSVCLAILLAPVLAYEGSLLLTTVIHSGPNGDGTFIWEIKARYFAAVGGVPQSIFHDLSRPWSHLEYPFLLPLMEALAFRALGAPSQGADMVVTAAFVLSLLVLLHEMVRRTQGFGLAVAFALLMITIPAFWDNALQAFADLPLALFILAGAWFVYRWFDHGRRLSDLLLGGVLLALAIWMKREGIVVWATGAGAIGAWTVWTSFRRRSPVWRPLLAYLAPVVVILPWWEDVARSGLQDHDFAFTYTWFLNHVDRVPTLFQALGAQLALLSAWGITWVLVGAGILLRPPRSPGRGFLVAAVAAHLFAITFAYTFSTWDPYMAHVNASI